MEKLILTKSKSLDQLPSCVLLDLDNTLYAYEPAHQAALFAAARVGLELLNVDEKEFLETFDDARAEIKRRLGHTASSHHRLLYFQRLVERLGVASQVGVVMQLEQAYWSAFLQNMSVYPNVYEFLDDLRLAGIPCVLVTDLTSEIQFRKFMFLKLNRYIDWIVTSEEVGADKPNPKVYELALAKLGGVEGDIWMIGDNPKADIEGAKKAVNAITFQIESKGIQKSECADFFVRNFYDLRKHLKSRRYD